MIRLVWRSTFHGVHHLMGGDPRLKIWIEEYSSISVVNKANSNSFAGDVITKSGTLEDCKKIGEKWMS